MTEELDYDDGYSDGESSVSADWKDAIFQGLAIEASGPDDAVAKIQALIAEIAYDALTEALVEAQTNNDNVAGRAVVDRIKMLIAQHRTPAG